MKDRKSAWRRVTIIGLSAVALSCCLPAGAVYWWWKPKTHLFAASTSPDGKYRCEVIEHTPGGLMLSPYDYDFVILDARTGSPISGSPHKTGYDSSVAPKMDIAWTKDHCTVTEANAGRYQFICDLSSGSQNWTETENP